MQKGEKVLKQSVLFLFKGWRTLGGAGKRRKKNLWPPSKHFLTSIIWFGFGSWSLLYVLFLSPINNFLLSVHITEGLFVVMLQIYSSLHCDCDLVFLSSLKLLVFWGHQPRGRTKKSQLAEDWLQKLSQNTRHLRQDSLLLLSWIPNVKHLLSGRQQCCLF